MSVQDFLELTADEALKNFSELSFGQRKELVRLSNSLKDEVERLKSIFQSDDQSKSTANNINIIKKATGNMQMESNVQTTADPRRNEILNEKLLSEAADLGCGILNEVENLDAVSKGEGMLLTTPSYSKSFSTFKLPFKPSQPKSTKNVKECDVEPMDILPLLNSERGRKIIQSVKVNMALSNSDQIYLMDRIHAEVTKNCASPFKNYPETSVKVAIAKGIVKAFPELKCSGDCEYRPWLVVAVTKFESMRKKNGQRKNKKRQDFEDGSSLPNPPEKRPKSNSNQRSTVTSGLTSTAVSASDSLDSSGGDSTESISDGSDLALTLKKFMDRSLANTQNKQQISMSLATTFDSRRAWINLESPSCTSILIEYKHLQSYDGEMISEEFLRMEPLQEEIVGKFQKISPLICKHAKVAKASLYIEFCEKFGHNENLFALLLLPKLLPTSLNSKTATEQELSHLKKFKSVFEQVPSTALLQIAPEGTDAFFYRSIESSGTKEEPTPMFPFLLWLSNDCKSGQIYLKIDSLCFNIGYIPSTDEDPLLRAVSLLLKAHYVFNLKYHPYLHTVFNFFEVLSGISCKPRNTVEKLMSTIRELSKGK